MTINSTGISDYLEMYQYLPVLDDEQIFKLRNVAIGILDMTAFSEEEMLTLESRISNS
jgi:hypothetical protein